MSRLDDAIERIKILECPTGEVENRIAGILEDYGVAGRNEITIKREENFDRDGGEVYRARIQQAGGRDIVVRAKSGFDDYVAKVVDVRFQ